MYKIAYKYDDNVVFYFDYAGNKYVASGGNLAWRINNPGLIRSHSHFAYRNGAIGNHGSFAIFADPTCGRKALQAWLQSKKYFNSSLKTLGEHYNPSDPEAFLSQLASLANIPINSKIISLNNEEFNRLFLGIEKLCGYSSKGNEIFRLLPKILAKIENGNSEDSYLIGDNTLLSKKEAIQWVLTHRLDAVIIHEQNDKTHLRSRPHYSFRKIRVHINEFSASLMTQDINTLVRIVGEKRLGQVIWGFINGIDNTKEQSLASATLISQAANGEQVLSMPNDTIWKGVDLAICGILKAGIDTPLVTWTVKFFRYLLSIGKCDRKPVVVFAHSQGAIYIEHALEMMSYSERKLLRIFTFGGGSFIEPEKCHPDSHNYASAADFVCRVASPNYQYLALKRYYGLKSGLSEKQVVHQLAFEDAIFRLDTIDIKTLEMYTKSREKFYEQELAKIKHITILDPDPNSDWKHEFTSDCYQATVLALVKKCKENE